MFNLEVDYLSKRSIDDIPKDYKLKINEKNYI
jgi:hypothetical protein